MRTNKKTLFNELTKAELEVMQIIWEINVIGLRVA